MIIFGTTGLKSTLATGNFYCPQCKGERPYKHKKVTKFFTLYFIPLIPLGNVGEFVECQSCKGTFVKRAINNQGSAPQQKSNDDFKAIYEKAIRHSMVMIMLADGVIDENEKVQVLEIINKYGRNDLTMKGLEDYIKLVQLENKDVSTYLKEIEPQLNNHGKEVIIKCAFAVAQADGYVDESELRMITQMGKALDMSPAHIKGIHAEIFEASA